MSRVPQPIRLDRYRWATNLAWAAPVRIAGQETILIGATTQKHRFSVGAGAGCPPILCHSWGYGKAGDIRSPGPILEVDAGTAVTVNWENRLPDRYPFVMAPHDLGPAMMMDRYETGRSVVHLHGAHLPWTSDGYPQRLPKTTTGKYANPTGHKSVLRSGEKQLCDYPNTQLGGATLWYHDHTMDRTARNVYAGLAGAYLIRHPNEFDFPVIPSGRNEYCLILQDKSFVAHPKTGKPVPFYGDVNFLYNYHKVKNGAPLGLARQLLRTVKQASPPLPEFKGSVICVNGKIWPTLKVRPEPYRFRLVNGASSRIFVLRTSREIPGATTLSLWRRKGDIASGSAGPPIYQIGSDGGFLRKTASLDGSVVDPDNMLVLAPGERADIIIDFSGNAGKAIYITNHAGGTAPLGNGGDEADRVWEVGESMGLDQVLRFEVEPNAGAGVIPSVTVPDLDLALSSLANIPPNGVPPPSTRTLILKEFTDIPLNSETLNLPIPHHYRPSWAAITFGSSAVDPQNPGDLWGGRPPNAKPKLKHRFGPPPLGGPKVHGKDRFRLNRTAEIWDIYNISADIHPIHIHHTQFRIVERFEITDETTLALGGSLAIPDNELGWKDTIRSNNAELIRIEVRFDDAGDTSRDYTGNYVLHCHLLDHEDMGMMRPVRID